MTGGRRKGRYRPAKTVAFLAVAILLILLPGGSADARQENPDVDSFARYEYRPDTEAGLIDVTITLEVTADKPNRRVSGGIYQYYIEGYVLTIAAAARELTVTDQAGRTLDYEVVYSDEWLQSLSIDFRRNVFYRQTATVVVDYDLVEDRDSEYELTRVNDAYIATDVWPDPLLEAAEVEVVTPPGFSFTNPFEHGTDGFTITAGADETRFIARDIDPENFFAVLSVDRPDRLIRQEFEVDGHQILLQSWPGDDVWSAEARTTIETGLPLLIDAVDLDWPIDEELTVTESYDPTLAGYAGWYDTMFDEISLGDVPDDHVILHELAHLWFHHELFSDRWITEGLAETYGAEVVEAMDSERPEPESVSLLDSVAVPLSRWPTVADVDPELELWAYAASWTVTEAIVAEVGVDTLDEVIQAAADNHIAYPGEGEPELSAAPRNWTWYLDLLENHADDTGEALVEIFEDWVAAPSDRPTLAARAENRIRYAELVEQGDGWAAPSIVRAAMSMWAFRAAANRMDTSEALLDRRDALLVELQPVDVELPALLESVYEESEDPGMSDVASAFDDVDAAAAELLDAHRHLDEANGVFQRIGALGADLDIDLGRMDERFAEGEFDAVADDAAQLNVTVDGLARTGMIRSGAAGTVIFLLAVVVLWFRRRRRSPKPSDRRSSVGGSDDDRTVVTAEAEAVGDGRTGYPGSGLVGDDVDLG